jgi:hypothetical protein
MCMTGSCTPLTGRAVCIDEQRGIPTTTHGQNPEQRCCTRARQSDTPQPSLAGLVTPGCWSVVYNGVDAGICDCVPCMCQSTACSRCGCLYMIYGRWHLVIWVTRLLWVPCAAHRLDQTSKQYVRMQRSHRIHTRSSNMRYTIT